MHGPIRTVRPGLRSETGAAVVDTKKSTINLSEVVDDPLFQVEGALVASVDEDGNVTLSQP